ncbi:flavin reductase family protein [Spelaeicoccus albus]|uniref:Flavin reductase (DIM6/NTAB) family NADH-FMN oxidoreductase RutF n=1 Tax=Spelaeicoccus albus TaxID=1280376 RepID=A0A7Z0CZH7_9MICO|nr:flavin reductase family protein [Spelaeicoccus albus]NYI66341.1 flavin reductase (DIM6/NTAB) family NADH-FMN oxidoreductase RutF [Spelaeicoccus albus]
MDTSDVSTIDPGHVGEADKDRFRTLSSSMAQGTAVVTAIHQGHDYASPVTAYLSVSYDPPTLLISLYADGRIAEAVESADRWTLSLLNAEQKSVADWLAAPGSPLHGLLRPVPHVRPRPGAPVIIDKALAWFEVETTAIHPAATHLLVVGEVRAMGRTVPPDAVRHPLLRFDGRYRRLD